jgi:membrane-bound lytic murein transglycosylase MltF
MKRVVVPIAVGAALWLAGCGDDEPPPTGESDPIAASPAVEQWTGDFDGMVERRRIRALVPYSPTFYFFDRNGGPRGLSHAYMTRFEDYVNERLDAGLLKVSVVFVPVTRDRLIPWLLDGRGDVIAADLTRTDARARRVRFTEPVIGNVRELLVSGPDAEPIERLEQLAGRRVLVRRESSYYESLRALNERFAAEGRAPVRLEIAPGHFEVGDMLEMANAGVAEHVVADEYLADFWAQLLPDITVHDAIVLRDGGDIAFAVRPDNDVLADRLNDFLDDTRAGTLFGNVTLERYLEDTRWVDDPTRAESLARMRELADLFQRYAGRYGLDWLLLTAQGYQESRLDHSARSSAGAVGIMQILPSTAADLEVGDISEIDNNIHAAAKYVRWMIDRYYDDPEIEQTDRVLLALASYNAGPRRVRQMREEAVAEGLDPNRWFDHVEVIAARRIGRETVDYVRNIFKYYVAYRLVAERNRLVGEQESAFE